MLRNAAGAGEENSPVQGSSYSKLPHKCQFDTNNTPEKHCYHERESIQNQKLLH